MTGCENDKSPTSGSVQIYRCVRFVGPQILATDILPEGTCDRLRRPRDQEAADGAVTLALR